MGSDVDTPMSDDQLMEFTSSILSIHPSIVGAWFDRMERLIDLFFDQVGSLTHILGVILAGKLRCMLR